MPYSIVFFASFIKSSSVISIVFRTPLLDAVFSYGKILIVIRKIVLLLWTRVFQLMVSGI